MSSGTKLTSIRKARKLGRTQLARVMGVSRTFIYQLENDQKQPGPEFIDRLQVALDLTSEEHQELQTAVAFGRRRILLGRHLDHERVELIHHFVNRIEGLECAPVRALIDVMPKR